MTVITCANGKAGEAREARQKEAELDYIKTSAFALCLPVGPDCLFVFSRSRHPIQRSSARVEEKKDTADAHAHMPTRTRNHTKPKCEITLLTLSMALCTLHLTKLLFQLLNALLLRHNCPLKMLNSLFEQAGILIGAAVFQCSYCIRIFGQFAL